MKYALLMMITVMMVMVMMMPMVTARDEDEGTRKSRGQIQLIVDGLLTLMENDDGRWN